ncbi:unnamed protein product, partial [Oikopleura dioica]
FLSAFVKSQIGYIESDLNSIGEINERKHEASKLPIPQSANLDCSYDPFNSLVGARGIGLHLDEELPFLVHVIANDREICNGIILGRTTILAPTACCTEVEKMSKLTTISFSTNTGSVRDFAYLSNENGNFCSIELEESLTWSSLTRPACFPQINEQFGACWELDTRQAFYKSKSLEMENCSEGDFCSSSFGCRENDVGNPVICLNDDNQINMVGFKESCLGDINVWSSLTVANNNDYILASSVGSSLPPSTTNVPRTRPASLSRQPVNKAIAQAPGGKYQMTCMRCSGKNFFDCHKRAQEVKCALDEVCFTSVRKRNGRLIGVIKDCKQKLACLNMRKHNFKNGGQDDQCKLQKKRGPSVCRQCCDWGKFTFSG